MMELKKVLLIEDSVLARMQVRQVLDKQRISTIELENADDFLEATWRYRDVDLIILDINLPGTDGLTALSIISVDRSVAFIPVIMLSGLSDVSTVQKALQLGAIDFICKPFDEKDLILRVKKVLDSSDQQIFMHKHSQIVYALKDIFLNISSSKDVPISQLKNFAEQCVYRLGTVKMANLLNLPGKVDDYTYYHSLNVGILAGMVAQWLGFSKAAIEEVVLAGLLHDVGKTKIPPQILNKPGRLTTAEMEIMKKHSYYGYELLHDNKYLSPSILLGILQHHERMDGNGYSQGLRGQKIHINARIIAIVDMYDAMTSNRVYRQAQTPFFVIEELFYEMKTKLDLDICSVFLDNLKNNLISGPTRLLDAK